MSTSGSQKVTIHDGAVASAVPSDSGFLCGRQIFSLPIGNVVAWFSFMLRFLTTPKGDFFPELGSWDLPLRKSFPKTRDFWRLPQGFEQLNCQKVRRSRPPRPKATTCVGVSGRLARF